MNLQALSQAWCKKCVIACGCMVSLTSPTVSALKVLQNMSRMRCGGLLECSVAKTGESTETQVTTHSSQYKATQHKVNILTHELCSVRITLKREKRIRADNVRRERRGKSNMGVHKYQSIRHTVTAPSCNRWHFIEYLYEQLLVYAFCFNKLACVCHNQTVLYRFVAMNQSDNARLHVFALPLRKAACLVLGVGFVRRECIRACPTRRVAHMTQSRPHSCLKSMVACCTSVSLERNMSMSFARHPSRLRSNKYMEEGKLPVTTALGMTRKTERKNKRIEHDAWNPQNSNSM